MRAIQIQAHGGPEVLQAVTLPDPEPGPGDALVRIKAAALNPLDGIIRTGLLPEAKRPPLILGQEAAGVVERDGGGFRAGERVIVFGRGLGVFRDGTWAEYVSVPAAFLRRVPEGLSFEEAAALPLVGVTAYGALRLADLRAGETMVALGATGGVGSAGVQIGKALGARVIAAVSTPEKAGRVGDLRPDHVIALSAGPLAEQVDRLSEGRGADVILDPVGGELTGRAVAALAPCGRLVHVGTRAGTTLTISSIDLIAKLARIIGFNLFLIPQDHFSQDLSEVLTMAAQRRYRAFVDRAFPLARAADAMRALEERRGVGKVVLTM